MQTFSKFAGGSGAEVKLKLSSKVFLEKSSSLIVKAASDGKWEELSREIAFQKYSRKIEKVMDKISDKKER